MVWGAWLATVHRVTQSWTRLSTHMQSSEGLTKVGGHTSKLAHSYGKQVCAGYGQSSPVPHHVGLFRGLLKCSHDMVPGFLQIWCERPSLRSHTCSFHFCTLWIHRPARILCVRGFYKRQIQKVKVILDPILLYLNFFVPYQTSQS